MKKVDDIEMKLKSSESWGVPTPGSMRRRMQAILDALSIDGRH